MTKKERLVEDVKLQIFSALGNVNCDTCIYKDYDMEPCRLCHIKYNQWAISKDTLQNLAESIVKRAIKNGVIVPSCNVGDMVYDIGGFPKIMKAEIETITTDGTEMSSVVVNQNKPYHRWFINWRDIGKTVFLTREAAEKELKERETK